MGDDLVLGLLTKFCTCRNAFGEESMGKRREETTMKNYTLSVRVPSEYSEKSSINEENVLRILVVGLQVSPFSE